MPNDPTIEDFMSRGFFPKELPPCFSSMKLGTHIGKALAVAGRKNSTPLPLSIPRAGVARRRLSIPNPREQAKLAKLVADNWTALDAKMRTDPTSLSVAAVGPDRAVRARRPFSDKAKFRVRSRRRGSYLLIADISRFYESIYTHSLEWAEHGKSEVKQKRKTGESVKGWGKDLDEAVRAGNGNQTTGIPIGPDTSLVLSEVILAEALAPLKLDTRDAWRYADDLEIVTRSLGKAEDLYGKLEESLGRFELALNPLKSEIVPLPTPYDSPEIVTLRNHRLRTTGAREFQYDAINLMSTAYASLGTAPTTLPVVKFALQTASRVFFNNEVGWREDQRDIARQTMLDLHLGAVSAEPATLPYLDVWLDNSRDAEMQGNADAVMEILDQLVQKAAPTGHSYEVAWAIHISRRLRRKLHSQSGDVVLGSSDPMVQTIGIAGVNWGAFDDSVTVPDWAEDDDSDAVNDERWLMSYQSWRFGISAGAETAKDEFFAKLNELDVDFLHDPAPYALGAEKGPSCTRQPKGNTPPLDTPAEIGAPPDGEVDIEVIPPDGTLTQDGAESDETDGYEDDLFWDAAY